MKIIVKHLLTLMLLWFVIPLHAQHDVCKKEITLPESSSSTLVAFFPEQPSGRAVVALWDDADTRNVQEIKAKDWASFFVQRGISFFVVKYSQPDDVRSRLVADAEKAVKIVRDSAAVWHINPYDVGIMGWDMGGYAASVVSTQSAFAVRPDFTLLFNPVISPNAMNAVILSSHGGNAAKAVGKETNGHFSAYRYVRPHLTPEAALFLTNDDKVVNPLLNGIAYYAAMHRNGNACALFVYPKGGHDFGSSSASPCRLQLLGDLSSWLNLHQASATPQSVRVACIGNSITDGYGIYMADANGYPAVLQKLLGKRYTVRNFGVSSRTMLRRGDWPYVNELAWRDTQAFNPDIVVLKLGTNDSKPENWRFGADFEADLLAMVDTLQALPAHPVVYLATPIPAFKPTWNINDSVIVNAIVPVIRSVARKRHCKVIDLHTAFAPYDDLMQADGIHPTAEGAAKMAEFISAKLKSDQGD